MKFILPPFHNTLPNHGFSTMSSSASLFTTTMTSPNAGSDPHRLPAPLTDAGFVDLPDLRSRTPTPSAEDRAVFNANLASLTFRAPVELPTGVDVADVHVVCHYWFRLLSYSLLPVSAPRFSRKAVPARAFILLCRLRLPAVLFNALSALGGPWSLRSALNTVFTSSFVAIRRPCRIKTSRRSSYARNTWF